MWDSSHSRVPYCTVPKSTGGDWGGTAWGRPGRAWVADAEGYGRWPVVAPACPTGLSTTVQYEYWTVVTTTTWSKYGKYECIFVFSTFLLFQIL